MSKFERIPIAEQDPKVRATNFDEVCLGYTAEEAIAEAKRCIQCKKPKRRETVFLALKNEISREKIRFPLSNDPG